MVLPPQPFNKIAILNKFLAIKSDVAHADLLEFNKKVSAVIREVNSQYVSESTETIVFMGPLIEYLVECINRIVPKHLYIRAMVNPRTGKPAFMKAN